MVFAGVAITTSIHVGPAFQPNLARLSRVSARRRFRIISVVEKAIDE
jgi:hypothetical protein